MKAIQRAAQLMSPAICTGTILLLAMSAPAQNLFEADTGSENIYEFTPSGAQSTFASSGLLSPSGLAFDSAGDLFVADASANIYEFTPNGVESTFASGPFFLSPTGMAFNKAGDLFVATSVYGIIEVTPGGAQSIFADGAFFGLAINSAGDLFASCGQGSQRTSGDIVEFTPNGMQSTFASGLTDPAGLVFNSVGDLFVLNLTSGIINEITPNGVQSTFAAGIPNPVALVFDSIGDLFVGTASSGPGDDTIYKYTTQGTRSIFNPGLYVPQGLAFQPIPTLQAAATNGTFQLTVTMPSPYYTTIVQASPDLKTWVNLCTNTPPFTCTDSMASPLHFYRAVLDTNSY